MNFFEMEIARHERRVKDIREKPDPTKLRSNGLLYEIWLDFRKRELKAWQEGKPFVYDSGGIPPLRLLTTMGLYPLLLPSIGDRAGSELAEEAFRTIWAKGFPDPGCDRTLVPIGMAMNGRIPPPSLVIDAAGICIPETSCSLWAGLHFGVPRFCFDIRYDHSYEGLQYLVKQMREMIDFVEREIPGAKYDEDKLVELQDRAKLEHQVYREVHQLKKAVPCPLSAVDAFRLPAWEIVDDPRTLRYAEMYRDELRERVKMGVSAVGKEKLRVAWLVSGPFHSNPFAILERKGVSVPWFEFGQAAGQFALGLLNYGLEGDEAEYGRKLTPLEEEARRLNHNTWGGPAVKRAVSVIQACREMKIDAIIHYQLAGCVVNMGSAKIVADMAERELGIPSLMVEGFEWDARRWNQEEYNEKITNFIDTCFMRKGIA